MPIAFVLISAETGIIGEVMIELAKVGCVSEAHVVYGVYDILVKVEGSTVQEIKDVIMAEIESLDHVEGTMTLLVAEPSQIQNITIPAVPTT
ncbi:MAG: Lrp/AsnC family transcriptional regulator [Thaumarchaeota archaeon]|nr:Lrp/AsnC family transcriptional regulator [Nitrososphaerota archaeon]